MTQLAPPSFTLAMTLIDRSGSMWPFAEDLKGSFMTYLRDLQAAPEAERIVLGVGSFSSLATQEEIKPTPVLHIAGLPELRYDGDTPLYAAVAQTIQKLLMKPADPHLKIVLNVLTDGQDTCSKPSDLEWLFNALVPAALLRGFRLSIVGFGVDGEEIARQMGFIPGGSISVPRTSEGMRASFVHMGSTTLGSWGN